MPKQSEKLIEKPVFWVFGGIVLSLGGAGTFTLLTAYIFDTDPSTPDFGSFTGEIAQLIIAVWLSSMALIPIGIVISIVAIIMLLVAKFKKVQ